MMDSNLNTYSSEKVVSYYENYTGLQGPEKKIAEILSGSLGTMNMLDIGIGGGRTTAYFGNRVKKYTGIDYAEKMVEVTRRKFQAQLPHARFETADARHLNDFTDNEFDFILFSFNGIDYMPSEDRPKVLKEINRVLKKGGVFCFSTHNLNRMKDLPAFEFRLNLVAAVRRAIEVKKINKINAEKLKKIDEANYLEINDGAHDFKLSTAYFKPVYQVKQLQDSGFQNIQVFRYPSGNEIPTAGDELLHNKDSWLYFLCSKV